MQTRPHSRPRRSLSGCRLFHGTARAVPPLCWPWSPSLPAPLERLGPPFGGLPVLRDHPTPRVPSPSRRFLLDDYRSPGGAPEAVGLPLAVSAVSGFVPV